PYHDFLDKELQRIRDAWGAARLISFGVSFARQISPKPGKRRGTSPRPLRARALPEPTPNEIKRRIEQIHQPYHDFLDKELQRIRDAWGAALLIDLHSMPPLRRRSGEERAPRIVLGDRYGASCDSVLADHAFRYLEHHGCQTAHNRPYSGGYVLDRHARPARGIHGIQIEVCRTTYLDTAFSETTPNAKSLAQMLAGLVRVLGAETAGLASGGQVAQAAE
ncbi:MAG: N-formylglutamate amidohydrolase, partial [Pseudomonadota bacterium]